MVIRQIFLSSIASTLHLCLGYFLYQSDFLFFGQGSEVMGLLFIPFVSFAWAQSLVVSIVQFLLLLVTYFFLTGRVLSQREEDQKLFWLILMIPLINIGCFGLLFFT